ALVHYDWPGNVRELQHVIERAVILSANGVLCPQVPARSPGTRSAAPVVPQSATLDDAMRAHILDALHATNWVVAGSHGAAVRLGLKRSTLYCKMAKLGIVRPREILPRGRARGMSIPLSCPPPSAPPWQSASARRTGPASGGWRWGAQDLRSCGTPREPS